MKLWWGTVVLVVIALIGWGLLSQPEQPNPTDLPNPNLTWGAIDSNVTQDNIDETICVSGYSASVRPSSYKTGKMKLVSMEEYGYTDSPSNYEYDHDIPLELGGCPLCEENLWPEPWNGTYGARTKDKLENYLHKQVCNGEMNLSHAQYLISYNWIETYNQIY